jgi:SAM-dependent methyltransferase
LFPYCFAKALRSRGLVVNVADYTEAFYLGNKAGSRGAAAQIVPHVIELMRPHAPRSVVDFGCGIGTWLSVFKEHGAEEIVGVDGDWVRRENSLIAGCEFIAADFTAPTQLGRAFDLVISMEVAEHIPAKHAESFVDTLTSHGGIVLFSAAIPFQGGVSHVNEQWPAYWAALFAARGYLPADCLRGKFWNNPQVPWWYAQNCMFFVREEELSGYPLLQEARRHTSNPPQALIHPARYLEHVRKTDLKHILKRLGQKTARGLGVENGLREHLRKGSPIAEMLHRFLGKGRDYGGGTGAESR